MGLWFYSVAGTVQRVDNRDFIVDIMDDDWQRSRNRSLLKLESIQRRDCKIGTYACRTIKTNRRSDIRNIVSMTTVETHSIKIDFLNRKKPIF